MNDPVLSSLLPVVLLIAAGYGAGRMRWLSTSGARELSTLVFYLLVPALLFRTMGKVRLQELDFTPVAAYFVGLGIVFTGTLVVRGFSRRGAVLALASTFSNSVMIGIPLVGLAFGEAGLRTLFTLYTVHTVVLLTCATLVLELSALREAPAAGAPRPNLGRSVATAVRNSLIHPVPLPILAGLAFAQTGWVLPDVVDKPLQLLGAAFGPVALLLVGVTMAHTRLAGQLREALALVAAKNLAMPALVAAGGVMLGLTGLPLWVVVVVASLPAGANSFLFSQRYKVAEDTVTTTVALSTVIALVTVPIVMTLSRAL